MRIYTFPGGVLPAALVGVTGRREVRTADAPARDPIDGYLPGSYRIATAPEPNSSRLTSSKSTYFDSPANNVGP